jgi:uncharacterized protein (DUF302 family)
VTGGLPFAGGKPQQSTELLYFPWLSPPGQVLPQPARRLTCDSRTWPQSRRIRVRREYLRGLMIFGAQDHGALLAIAGTPRKAKRYHIGNPLIALQMTQHDIRAGLYAPLTVLVYEMGPSTVRVEFDRPSSLFGQFENPAATRVATELDTKLCKAIETAASEWTGHRPQDPAPG